MLDAELLKKKLKESGADLVGITQAGAPLVKKYGEMPEKILPGAQSFITFAVALNRSAVCSGNMYLARFDTMCVYDKLNRLSLEVTKMLVSNHARAVGVPPYLPLDMGGDNKGLKGEINLKIVAASAGLGSIGLNGLLVSPEFGPFLRLGAVVTDAFLEADYPLEENPCTFCGLCQTACPVQAIKKEGGFDRRACAAHVMRTGLPGVLSIARKLIDADEKTAKSVLYSPEFWEVWQSTFSGSFYCCFECISSCPIGIDFHMEI